MLKHFTTFRFTLWVWGFYFTFFFFLIYGLKMNTKNWSPHIETHSVRGSEVYRNISLPTLVFSLTVMQFYGES